MEEKNASQHKGGAMDPFESIFELSPDCMFKIRLSDFKFVAVNPCACDFYGYSKEEFHELFVPDIEIDEQAKVKVLHAAKDFAIGQVVDVEGVGKKKNGATFPAQIRFCKLDEHYAIAILRDITSKKEIESLNAELSQVLEATKDKNWKLKLNRDILGMVVQHQPLEEILTALCRSMEKNLKRTKVSILLLGSDGKHLFNIASPSLPQAYIQVIDGMPIGPMSGACGTAAYSKKEVIIEDTLSDERCIDFVDLILKYDLKACWSTPIISSEKVVLGTFALYFDEIKKPKPEELDLLNIASDLAEIAIEQSNYQTSLKKIHVEYAAQNKELVAAKKELETDKKILLESQERLEEAQRLSRVGHWEFDFVKFRLIWSEEQYRVFELEGVPQAELYEAYRNRIHPDDILYLRKVVESGIESGQEFKYEHRIICDDGSVKYILGIGRVFKDENGRPLKMKGTEQDVTELKKAQESALENERRLNELLANINEIVFAVDLVDAEKYDNPLTYLNGDTLGIFGYSHEELMAVPILWTDRIHPEDLEEVIRVSEGLHKTQKQVVREYRFKHKKGHYVWIEDNVSLGKKEGESYQVLYGSVRNINERKEADAALLESKERLQLATQATKLGTYDWRIKEGELHWDEQMHELFGLDKKNSSDKIEYFEKILHPEDKKRVLDENLLKAVLLSHENQFKREYRIIVNGETRYIENYRLYFRDKKGEVYRVIGTCLNITERKQAEALLISNEEKDVLLKEIHHRVKNNLQVITSLLSLQSSFIADEKQKVLFSDSQYRINSMAIVHEMLYQSHNLSKLDYEKYLKELSQFLIGSMKGTENNITLLLEVPSINLGIDTAIPLGLLINEVLTNSLKYGIQGNDAGTISIKINALPDETATFLLEIGDDGGGYPTTLNFKNSKSLGLRLITNLTRQLEGSIERDFSKKGTNYKILFKEI